MRNTDGKHKSKSPSVKEITAKLASSTWPVAEVTIGLEKATSHVLATDDNLHQYMETFWKLEECDTLVNEKIEMSVNDTKALSAPPPRIAS